ncbi:hypothetical protein [Chryseobacterium gambrini]|uniref:hypothetical protein n=1 Tax=Chryseobacterium gambrini TaxID=373672 RepID=UPI003BA7DB64
METSFFSGSENLYKYLVSIGILMLVLTIYYPLKEKQSLEILKIELLKELKTIEYSVTKNENKAILLSKKVSKNEIDENQKSQYLQEIKTKQIENEINKIKADAKLEEIETRNNYIIYYNIIIWIFAPLGLFLVVYGFLNWRKSKKNDDEKATIEKDLLKLTLERQTRENLRDINSQDDESTSL